MISDIIKNGLNKYYILMFLNTEIMFYTLRPTIEKITQLKGRYFN